MHRTSGVVCEVFDPISGDGRPREAELGQHFGELLKLPSCLDLKTVQRLSERGPLHCLAEIADPLNFRNSTLTIYSRLLMITKTTSWSSITSEYIGRDKSSIQKNNT